MTGNRDKAKKKEPKQDFTQKSEPRYVISVASRILGLEAHTLRYYERLGLVQPYRSRGNIRYYSEGEIDRLKRIKELLDEMGVNLSGVEVMMRMMEQMEVMQAEMNSLREQLTGESES